MLSILIPTYNYNCFSLVEELKNQADNLKIEYEIIVQDDCSKEFVEVNSKINSLENCSFQINNTNLGRTRTRQILSKKAKFELLVFLDSDVFPEKKTFIKEYLEKSKINEVCFGGYKYCNLKPKKSKILRYKYGKEREEKSSEIRNKNPYSFVFSGNMLIQKNDFIKCNFNEDLNLYGMDIYFSHSLFINKINVIHIDNAIFHNGLEENTVYFNKCLESVESRKKHLLDKKEISKINSLIKYYLIIKKLGLEKTTYWIFLRFEKKLKKLILNENPNLLYLDLYRLGYFCKNKSNK